MVRKADDNDMIDPASLKAFKRTRRLLKQGDNAREKIVSIEEYLRLYANAVPHMQAILTVAINTGMRRGEILALKWSHIDRDNRMIRRPAELNKDKRPKRIPINETVWEALNRQPRALHHDFVFAFQGKSISLLRMAFLGACRRAGIPYGLNVEGGFIFHDIRRTVKTNVAGAGIDKVYRDTILGHSLQGMDKHYLKPSDDDLHAAREKYTAWLSCEMANRDQNHDQAAQ